LTKFAAVAARRAAYVLAHHSSLVAGIRPARFLVEAQGMQGMFPTVFPFLSLTNSRAWA
jgi:hypothetical protein